MIRKAENISDVKDASRIYESIEKLEAEGVFHTGWKSGIYPTYQTALDAFNNGELYVFEDENGNVTASAIINRTCPDAYGLVKWNTDAEPDELLVLHTLSVDPSAKGRGIGKAFVAFYEAAARDLHCKTLRMDTNRINTSARELYKKLGFTEVGTVPCNFNGLSDVNLVMLEKLL